MREEKHHKRVHDDEDETPEPTSSAQQRHAQIEEDTAATLDEIDDVLEENAEQFVRSYVQKGGE